MATILHISDLYRDASSGLKAGWLLGSLHLDKGRFAREGVPGLDVAVESGDIAYGVSTNDSNSDAVLNVQYEEAQDFLTGLAELFFGSDWERVIVLPSNHDAESQRSCSSPNCGQE